MSKPRVLFDLFDVEKGEKLRDEGMESAAVHRKAALEIAKNRAWNLGCRQDTVTVDDVLSSCSEFVQKTIGNAAGSIFKTPDWEFTGEWRKSTRVSNHARPVRVWRLKR